jgi:hypothetical protein
LLSGTLWFNNTEKIRHVLDRWEEGASRSEIWEQKILAEVLKNTPDINIYRLPIEYCYISSLPNGHPPLHPLDYPVIVHHQVSRTLKKQITKV